jgi:trans-aconitate methyltransferase
MSTNDLWTGGYVAELPYTFGFYRELTPAIHNFALAVKGFAQSGAAKESFTYCELGCGQGVSVALLAAAHPGARFYATDFNPTHAAHGRRLAAAAGLTNITFFDDSFEELAARDLPEMDCIALHGVYSWISPEARRSIVAFIRKRLKVGGVVYNSYNSLPGWAAAVPMRDMMVAHAAGSTAPIAQRIEAAIGFATKVEASGSKYFQANPTLKVRLERLAGMSRNYLAHEYFNRDWHPMYFRDVAREMAEAKLDFVGSAHLTDHVDAVNLTTEQAQLLAETPDPMLQETLRDFMTNQQFRRDLYVRGPFRLAILDQLDQLRNMRFALSQAPADTPRTIAGLNGEATLQPEVYDPIINALGNGPITLRQLGDAPGVSGMDAPRVIQALTILVGGGSLQPSPDLGAKADAERKRSTELFNRAMMELSRHSNDYAFLASPVTCGGVQVDRFDQLFLLAQRNGQTDAVAFVWNVLLQQNQRMIRDGKLMQTAEENIADLTERHTIFVNKRLPVLKQLDIA